MENLLPYYLGDLAMSSGWCCLPWPDSLISLRESGDLGPSGFSEAALARRQAAFVAGREVLAARVSSGASRLPDSRTVLVATQTHSLRVICPLKDGRFQVWEGTWHGESDQAGDRNPPEGKAPPSRGVHAPDRGSQALDRGGRALDRGLPAGDFTGPTGPDRTHHPPCLSASPAGIAHPEGHLLRIRLVLEDSWDTTDLPGLARRTGAMEADGWLTDHPVFDLGVTVADCMSLFFRSPRGGMGPGAKPGEVAGVAGSANPDTGAPFVRGLVHSGWQGTGIAWVLLEAALAIWNLPAGSFDILAGPCITTLDYPVDPARARLFARRFGEAAVVTGTDGQPCLDLVSANAVLCGRPILSCSTSTLHDVRLQSYRRDGRDSYGRMLALWRGRT